MILHDLVQGSQEWLDFRRGKIGSSDAAVIEGESPWKTPNQLYREHKENFVVLPNEAMKRGTALEPIARQKFIEETGIDVRPAVGQNDLYLWQISSFDGLSEDQKIVLETKSGSLELHEKALRGEIPIYYEIQCQHHYCVSRADKVFYQSYYPGHEKPLKILEVKQDYDRIDRMLKNQVEFMRRLAENDPPELLDRDYELFEHARGSELLREYLALAKDEKAIKARRDALKEELIEISPGRNFILDGIKVFQSQNSSYDIKRMKADGIDVELYRKTSNPYWLVASPRGAKVA